MAKARRSPPVWLRNLHRVREDLQGHRYPRNANEGMRQTAELSAAALKMLEQQNPRRPLADVLARLAHAEQRRRERWQRERERFFSK